MNKKYLLVDIIIVIIAIGLGIGFLVWKGSTSSINQCTVDTDCGLVQQCGMTWQCIDGRCLQFSRECAKLPAGCENLCGDGICQEVVCMATGCPCAETIETCPQDCDKNADISGWETYRNEEYGFEFRYPVEMTLGGFEDVESPKLLTFWIDYKIDNKDLLLAVFPTAPYFNNLDEYLKYREEQNTPITLGDMTWYRFDVHALRIDYVQYFFEKSGNIYRVDVYDSKNENELKQILSTFKFIK